MKNDIFLFIYYFTQYIENEYLNQYLKIIAKYSQ